MAELFLESPPVEVLDRSTLQRTATCPMQARLHRDRKNVLMDAGSAYHDIVSAAIKNRIGGMMPMDVRETMKADAEKSRPDIQPDVLSIVRRSAYALVELLCFVGMREGRAPEDFMRFDGGEGEQSGQLSAEFDGSLVLTGELDCLLATPSPAEVELWDWKAGWIHWTPQDVLAEFQFQFYSWLIFENYPAVEVVKSRVFMPRLCTATQPVYFDRSRAVEFRARIASAVEIERQYKSVPLAQVPAWPDPDKCGACDAACRCPLADEDVGDCDKDPQKFLDRFVVLNAKHGRMKKVLSAHVRKTGADIQAESFAFGVGRPKSARQPTCNLYSVGDGESSFDVGHDSPPTD